MLLYYVDILTLAFPGHWSAPEVGSNLPIKIFISVDLPEALTLTCTLEIGLQWSRLASGDYCIETNHHIILLNLLGIVVEMGPLYAPSE